jgi:flagellar motor component MotA
MNPLVVRSAIVASLGGLIFGFDTAVISGTTDALKQVFHLSNSGLGFTVAIALIGTIVGALFAIFMVGQLIWVLKVMPETKGVPLEEMEYQLGLVHRDPARGAGAAPTMTH